MSDGEIEVGDFFRHGPFIRQATKVSTWGGVIESIPAIDTLPVIYVTANPLLPEEARRGPG